MERKVVQAGGRIRFVESSQVAGTAGRYSFGKATYLPNGSCGPRVQECYQLIVLLKGTLSLKTGARTCELGPGDATLEHPGEPEFFRFSATGSSVHSWCEIHEQELGRKERRLLRATNGVLQAPSAIHVLIEEGLAMRNHAGVSDAMAALAQACLLRFAQHAQGSRQTRDGTPPHPAYVRARELGEAEYAQLHSAQDLARRAHVSPAQLRMLFRQNESESPSRMIWRLKVEHAIQLLRSTGLTLGEVAVHCGYANPFHLSRAVKKHTGYAPRNLRRQEWQR